MYKLIIFVPKTHLEKVRQAVFEAGAGRIGNYDRCSFVSEGYGTFRPLKGSKPFIGKQGKLKKVKECRLEIAVMDNALRKTVLAMKAAHPYEEPAYDCLKLAPVR
jgi:hypothetical protein